MNYTEIMDEIDIAVRHVAAYLGDRKMKESEYDTFIEKILAIDPAVGAWEVMCADRKLQGLVLGDFNSASMDKRLYCLPLPKEMRPSEAVLPSSEFLEWKIPPRESLLVDRATGSTLFYASSINQVFAFRGLGKSVVGNVLTQALINGAEWLSFKAPKPRRVLLVDGELPAAQLQERLREFTGASENLHLISPEWMEDFPNLSEKSGQRKFLGLISRFHPDVIIFDTLTRCFRFDTNDPDAWLVVNDFLIELRSRGHCVIVIHHAGKNGTQRGRTDGDDNLDVAIKLEPPYGWQPGDGLAFKWTYEKVRHGGSLREFEAEYLPSRQWQVRDDTRVAEALEMHKAGKTQRSIAMALDLGLGTVNRMLRKAQLAEAVAKGRVEINE